MSDNARSRDPIFALLEGDDPSSLIKAIGDDRELHRLKDEEGASLILHCLYNGYEAAQNALLALGPVLTLHEAAALGREDVIRENLAKVPWAIDNLSPDGWTALHLAAFFGRYPVVSALLDAHADANVWSRAFIRNYPLHSACAGAHTQCALALIPVTTDLDAKDNNGYTPLMLAASHGLRDVVGDLIAEGASPRLRSSAGKTARDIAIECGHESIATILA